MSNYDSIGRKAAYSPESVHHKFSSHEGSELYKLPVSMKKPTIVPRLGKVNTMPTADNLYECDSRTLRDERETSNVSQDSYAERRKRIL